MGTKSLKVFMLVDKVKYVNSNRFTFIFVRNQVEEVGVYIWCG